MANRAERGTRTRPERPDDAGAIRDVVTAAFGRVDEADLVDRLRADGDSVISLVAEEGTLIVGHVLFSRLTADFPALALAPVSVAPGRQGEGIGGNLIRSGLGAAAASGWRAVFVVGEPDYYRRFGFDDALARGFTSPYAGPYLMAKGLGGRIPETGRIDYPRAFDGLD